MPSAIFEDYVLPNGLIILFAYFFLNHPKYN